MRHGAVQGLACRGNLFPAPLGKATSYDNAYELFCRLAGRAGFWAWLHMLRRSAITRIRRAAGALRLNARADRDAWNKVTR